VPAEPSKPFTGGRGDPPFFASGFDTVYAVFFSTMTDGNSSPSHNGDRQPSDADIPLLEIEQGTVPPFLQPRHRPPQPIRRKPLPSSANAHLLPSSSVSPGEAISDTSQHLPLPDSQDTHDQGIQPRPTEGRLLPLLSQKHPLKSIQET
jgi:hypothetical protein